MLENLRKKAAEIREKIASNPLEECSATQCPKLLQQLEIYKKEMELQREELLETKAASEKLAKEYSDLYDLHTRLILYYLKHSTLETVIKE